MPQFPRWKVDVTVGGEIVRTFYETATTAAAAIAKAKRKLRGAVSSAGAFKFSATMAGTTHATKKYGPKASEKVERTMREFKRGKLRSGRSGK
jgi:ribosomal protein S21